MPTKEPFTYNDVNYSTKENPSEETIDFSIVNPIKSKKPDVLYKYYSITNPVYRHSVDAFLNHYLFASHPSNLNDKYDCAVDLIDYSNLSVETLVSKLSMEFNLIPEENVRQIYNSDDRRVLDSSLAELYQMILYLKFGVISFTVKPDDILMWAYYSQNSGFVLKFRTTLLPKQIFGPFPINYVKTLEKIDYTKFNNSVCVLYQSNIKHELWKQEDEWRYLTFNKYGKYHPDYTYSDSDIDTRKIKYDLNAVEEVILGYDFFNISEIEFDKRTSEYDIIDISKSRWAFEWKAKFLNHIVDNSIQCSQIIRHRDAFTLGKDEKKIERVSVNKFKIIHSYKKILLF
jgi:hypothetical protein